MAFHGYADASSTHVVYKPGQTSCTTGDYYYNTIQEAVEAAGPVDSVIICPASEADPYVENVIAYKGWGDSKQGFRIISVKNGQRKKLKHQLLAKSSSI